VPATYTSDFLAQHPTDPSWNRFGDSLLSATNWAPEAGVTPTTPLGSGVVTRHDSGAETHDFAVSWQMERFPVDASGNANDPLGAMWLHDYTTDYPAYTLLARREFGSGGNFDAGYRDYTVGLGCKPTQGTITGDPSDDQPMPVEVQFAGQKGRSYVIHQPADTVDPELVSTSDDDTFDVEIESEGGSTTATVTLSGTTSANAGTQFDDIDAIYATEEPTGDISVTDGSGTEILEAVGAKNGGLQGKESDGAEGDRGIPVLGSGSHADPVGGSPGDYVYNAGQALTIGGSFDGRLHGSTITVSADATREPLGNGTNRQAIDIGPRTTEVEIDSASRYRSHTEMERHLHGLTGDVEITFPDGTFIAENGRVVSVGERAYEAEQANLIVNSTYRAEATSGGTEISATHANA
jgi:hypothetical protein